MADHIPTAQSGSAPTVDPSLVTYTHVIYALHTLSILIGLTSAATVVGAFIFGIPSIIAVIMNYARQSAVRGTYLESHFRWQIRTFWYAALWLLVIGAISFVLIFILIGFATWFIGIAAVTIWVIYRIARGWIALRDGRPMYT
ncbi:MAG: hypothetical protein DIU56_008820 [Pseudomonadota bacterium]|jgi:Predicted membrane protein|nr:MAG: hypothetical protein DIU56_02285 [Pseudomonadota bacterium]